MKTPPNKFFERLSEFCTQDEVDAIISGLKPREICSFRVNTLKSSDKEVVDYLDSKGIVWKKYEYLLNAYIIDKKDEYTLKGSELFYSGKIYVQGLSSMIPALVLAPVKKDRILDLTAAPGSKTTQIAAMIGNDGRILAIEKNQIRFDKLNYNIKLQGASSVETLKSDALKFYESEDKGTFDKILLDVPCSAEGRINLEDENTFSFWTENNIFNKQALQLDLLKGALDLLNVGGILVYSTCTLAPEENEGVIDKILKSRFDIELMDIDISIPNSKRGIKEFRGMKYNDSLSKTLRILPSQYMEGFFVAKILKK